MIENKDFLQFAWHSLTTLQQDKICVKYYISNNNTKSVSELCNGIEGLELNDKFIRSVDRIRKIKKYEIQLILDKLNDNTNVS